MWLRLSRYVLIAIALFLTACGIVAVAVPLLVEHVVLARAGDAIGRQVGMERIRFNPFTLTLSTGRVRVADQSGSGDFVTIEALVADLSISSLRYLAPVIDSATITSPMIRLQRTGDRRFNFTDIVERLANSPTDKPPPVEDAARFALHNLTLSGGEITLDDQVLGQKHRIHDLTIGVPLVSNLDHDAAVSVKPTLSAVINGSAFNLGGESMPFSATRKTSLDLSLRDVDIATYLALSPAPLGFKVPTGKLGSDLKINFTQEPGGPKLGIAGSVRIDDLRLDTRDGKRLVSARRLALDLDRLEPLAGRYAFGTLQADGLDVMIERGPRGDFALADAFVVGNAQREAPPAGPAKKADSPIAWSLHRTRVSNGRVTFNDQAVSPAVRLVHSDISIALDEIGSRQSAPAKGSLALKQDGGSQLQWKGTLDLPRSRAAGDLTARVTEIAPYLPYLSSLFAPGVDLQSGALAVGGALAIGWGGRFALDVSDANASVEQVRFKLPERDESALVVGGLVAEGVSLSLLERQASVSRLVLAGADIDLERDAAGQLNLQSLLAPSPEPAPSNSDDVPAVTAATDPAAVAWAVTVRQIDLERNRLAWHDLTAQAPVAVSLTDIAGRIEQVGTDRSLESTLDLSAQVGESGTIAARGGFVLAPWSMALSLQLKQLSLPVVDPYVAQRLTLSIDEGTLSGSGDLGIDGDRIRFSGQLAVDDLHTRERTAPADDAIRWKTLALDGIDLELNPAVPGQADRIAIEAVTLSDFFAKVVLSEQGRFNLQDLVRQAAPPQPGSGAAEAAETVPATESPGPSIRLGAVKLVRGRSNFTDRFVTPNYSVNLTELDGGLSAMASDDPAPAQVNLSGQIDDDAPIEISGRINPFGASLYADVRAEAKGIDLPKFSPYSGKYAGYAIEKGKLSLDVHYRIENGQLAAENQLVLDQLTLGEKVDSPQAPDLPLQFALSLLKNRQGEINLNLPVAGSLSDPQFSIGGILANALGNLLTRIITSPFAALASAFGSEESLSFVEFAPGTAELAQESIKKLGTMAKALTERPALKLEIAGRVDPKRERDAIKRQRLDMRLRLLQRREAGERLSEADERAALEPQAAGRSAIDKEQYPALVKQLYDEIRQADQAPAASGSAKPPGLEDMEKALLDTVEVDAEAVRVLALRRAQLVRDWLATEGKVSRSRMFTLAPRTGPDMTGPNRSKPQCPAACAEFSLR